MQNSAVEAPTDDATPYAVESVINAAQILLMLRKSRELQVGQVADDLGVARSTAHRLLRTLQSQNLLFQAATRRPYTAGPALVEIAASVVGAVSLKDRARPRLEQLVQEVGETIHLLVMRDTEVIFIDGVEGRHAIRAATRIGERELAHVSAAGKMLLSELPEEEIDRRYPDEVLTGGTDSALHTKVALKTELVKVRERGYALNLSESEAGLCAIAVAVRDQSDRVIGAISVSGPSMRLVDRVDKVATQLRDAVADIR